ncbi:MAG: bifunctional metallophosphatase/5'-nucleotidase [Bradymonadales bacterium]|nr:bifunctional metallophosphatase/5'-nucleotidase [Bradymonadales bacterium]
MTIGRHFPRGWNIGGASAWWVCIAQLLALLLVCSGACSGRAPGVRPEPTPPTVSGPVTITFVTLNDFHGGLYEQPLPGDPQQATGGLPWLVGAVEKLRQEVPDLILLDAGDMFQGSWPINATFGRGSIQVAHLLGVDATVVGNHDFDYGPGSIPDSYPTQALEDAMASSAFPWLSANIYLEGADAQPSERWQPEGLYPWTLIERRTVRIGLIGLTTTETPMTTQSRNVDGLEFADPVETVRQVVEELEEADADIVVVLGHLTGECPSPAPFEVAPPCRPGGEIGRLLDELPVGTIDVIVAGHAHALMGHRVDDTIILESLDGGRVLSRLDLVVGPEGPDLDASTIHPPWVLHHDRVDPGCEGGEYPLDPRPVGGRLVRPSVEALDLIASLESEVGSLCQVVGCSAEPLVRSGRSESPAGNLVADALLAAFDQVDVAVQNSGGLRTDLPAGPLRREQIQALMPFDNQVYLVELTGEQLRLMFRIGTSGAHGLLQVAGAEYQFSPDCGGGDDLDGDGEVADWEKDCLCWLAVGGQPVDPDRRYRVAVNDFLYHGGDNLGMVFDQAPIIEQGPLVRDAIITYLQAMGGCAGDHSPLADPATPRIEAGACIP